MTTDDRMSCAEAARAACMLRMRAAMGPWAMSSSRSVAIPPGTAIVAPEITKGLPEPARLPMNVSTALASDRARPPGQRKCSKARWMTPSLSRAPARRTGGVVHVTATAPWRQVGDRLGGGVRAGQPDDLVPGTDDSGTRADADPARSAGDEDAHGSAPWLCRRNADAIQSHRP